MWEEDTKTQEIKEGEKTFPILHDLITHVKTLRGKIQVFDETTPGFIDLDDGKVTSVASEFGVHDKYLKKHWINGGVDDEEEYEKTKYSIYDVYSQR